MMGFNTKVTRMLMEVVPFIKKTVKVQACIYKGHEMQGYQSVIGSTGKMDFLLCPSYKRLSRYQWAWDLHFLMESKSTQGDTFPSPKACRLFYYRALVGEEGTDPTERIFHSLYFPHESEMSNLLLLEDQCRKNKIPNRLKWYAAGHTGS